MYSPRPIPVLTGASAERFERLMHEAERPDAPKIDLRPFKASFEKIMARSKKSGNGSTLKEVSTKQTPMNSMQAIPETTYAVNAQSWPKDHVARIASMRVGNSSRVKRQIRSEVVR